MRNDTTKKEENVYPFMSPAQFNQAVTSLFPVSICLNFFRPNYTQPYLVVTIVFHSSLTQKKFSDSLRLRIWTSLTNSLVTFPSLISSLSKIPSNPVSLDETLASPLRSTNNPTNVIQNPVSSPSTGLQFSISIPEDDQSEITEALAPFGLLLFDV